MYESLAIGLSAILIAYSMDFTIAHQAFGDPFIMLLIGLVIGFTMAIPLAYEEDLKKWIKFSYINPPIKFKNDKLDGFIKNN